MSEGPIEVLFFPNGNTAACDVGTGQQIPELQIPWVALYAEYLERKGIDPRRCRLRLSPDLPIARYIRCDGDRPDDHTEDVDWWRARRWAWDFEGG